ncbi:hypothetical protein TGAMA5MH_10995 [Trichoderma gamsii]|uniref:Uncharacterized protein n=1 Tax=Trichoderma gamsii TaxID=398673 RepID=A0A2K0SV18_9HYPO|nr:hypothetical protein TGAMA5MH_10995 [Trichoderma gamsii]
MLYPTPKEEIQSFLQTWFWFGLLAEMLGLNEISAGVRLVESTPAAEGIHDLYASTIYISDDDGKQYISAKEVLNSAQLIAERQKLAPNLRERLIYIRDCLQYVNFMIPSVLNLDETVRYSICALGEYFSTGLTSVVAQSNPKIEVPNLAFSWHQNYMKPGGTIDKEMLQKGWCPSETEKIRSQFQGDDLNNFELVIEPYEPGVPYVALSHVSTIIHQRPTMAS